MAGISVTLEGTNIQLSFQKGEQATAVVMDPRAARALVRAVGQLLAAIGDDDEEAEDAALDEGEISDVTSPAIEVGTDQHGQPVIGLQAGSAPLRLRLTDEEARHVATSLLEILNAPGDIRASQGGH
jgi:hypothetical protein